MSTLESNDRVFQFNKYFPTHDHLLIRSGSQPAENIRTRIEITFGHVQYVCAPPVFRGIYLRRSDDLFRERMARLLDIRIDPGWSFYRLSRIHSWFIVSSPPSWVEVERDNAAPSVFFPASGELDADVTLHVLD